MSKNYALKPIGTALLQAGLVDQIQLQIALKQQSQSPQIPLGKILALRGWIKQETADFFAEKLPQLLQLKHRQPFGQYLQAAGLLNEQQIRAILYDQTKTGLKFGVLAVLKGWLNQSTIDFFLNFFPPEELSSQPEERLVNQEHKLNLSKILPKIRHYLLNNQKCHPYRILMLYQQILKQGEVLAYGSQEEKELLKLGFVKEHQGKLTIANSTYRSIFNQNWLEQELAYLQTYNKIKIKLLDLDSKASRPYQLLEEIMVWTNGQPILTQKICQIVSQSQDFIAIGEEAFKVEQLVTKYIINNWHEQKASKHLQEISNAIINNQVCKPMWLLMLYRQILEQKEIVANRSQEQRELVGMGLVSEEKGKLKVANRIYQAVFNQNWVAKNLAKTNANNLVNNQESEMSLNKINSVPSSTMPELKPPKSKFNYKIYVLVFLFLLIPLGALFSLNIFWKTLEVRVFQEATDLLHQGDYEQALAKYDELLKLDASHHQAWTNRGYALARLENYQEMLVSCSTATVINLSASYAWNCRGEALHNLDRHSEAIDAFDKAINLDPNDPIFWINKSESLLALKKYQPALLSIDQAIEILTEIEKLQGSEDFKRELAVSFTTQGRIFREMGEYELALKAYDRALTYDSHYFPALQGKGISFKQLKRTKEAIAIFKQILKKRGLSNAQKAETWFYKGLTFCSTGKIQEGIAAFELALQTKPDYDAAQKAKINCRGYAP